jgi:hypothetical protein
MQHKAGKGRERFPDLGRVDESYEDDPENGIFWGTPTRPGDEPSRWSRAWFDWRGEQVTARKHEAGIYCR